MSNWAKFRRLAREEKSALLAAFLLLPLVRAGLTVLGLRRMESLLRLGASGSTRPQPERLIFQAQRTARLVAVAACYTGGACLARSLVLCFLLERRGVPAQLRIGVRKRGDAFQAHAWVEAAGTTLSEAPDVGLRYAAFDRNFALARGNQR